MKKLLRQGTAWMLALVMAFSLVQMSTVKTKAAASIDMGELEWQSGKTQYTFPNAKVGFAERTQKIFCVSVDNKGYFEITNQAALDELKDAEQASFSGVKYDNDKYEYTDTIKINEKLSSITVICRSQNSGIKGIEKFLRQLTFYRNNVAEDVVQNVSAIANELLLPDDMTAIALENKIHYYQYVPFDDATDGNLTWYESYAKAKKAELNGLHGYLATITKDIEQEYVYKYYLSIYNAWTAPQAWIGGLRTSTDKLSGSDWDAPEIDKSKIYPGEWPKNGNRYYAPNLKEGDIPQHWYWMCGPEAGKSFYKTTKYGIKNDVDPTDADIPFSAWNGGEPNNTASTEFATGVDPYQQEYALEYGYGADGFWNDYSPYNVNKNNMRGYIIEFSPYSTPADRGGTEEKEKKASATADIPVAVVQTAKKTIDSAKLDRTTFLAEQKITISTVMQGSNEIDISKLDTDFTAQWQQYKEDTNTWESIPGATNVSYTPSSSMIGKKIRCEIKGINQYDGTVYVDASSVGGTDAVKGTTVVASNDEDPRIIADHVIVSKDTIPTTDEQIKKETNADVTNSVGEKQGADKVGVVEKTDLTKLAEKKEPGVATVTLKDLTPTNPAADKTVSVTVVDVATSAQAANEGDTMVAIGANHFNISLEQAKNWVKYGDSNAELASTLKLLANAIATEKPKDGSKGALVVDGDKINIKDSTVKGENGVYDITFEYKGVTATVKVTVKSNGTQSKDIETSKISLTGNDFVVKAHGDKLDKDTFLNKSQVVAQKTDGTKLDKDKITVNEDDLVKVNAAIENGNTKEPIPVRVTAKDGTTTTINVQVSIADEESSVSNPEKAKVQIGANNFKITPDDEMVIKNKTVEDIPDSMKSRLKEAAHVIALKDGGEVKNNEIVVKKVESTGEAGSYKITFAYDDAEVTVKAEVEVPSVSADSFILSKEDAKNGINPDAIKKRANVSGYNGTKENPIPVAREEIPVTKDDDKKPVTDTTSFEDGDIIYVTNGTAEDSAKVHVVDKTGEGVGTGEYAEQIKSAVIGANDFSISVEQAAKKDSIKNLLKQYAGVIANKDDQYGIREFLDLSEIAVDTSKIEAKNGIYPVEFSVPGTDAKVSVNCIVKSNGSNTTSDTEADEILETNLTGNDFSVPAGKENKLTEESFKEKANITATTGDGKTISLDKIKVVKEDFDKLNDAIENSKKGEYPVHVTTEDDTPAVIRITVTVKEEGNEDIADKQETIVANHYIIGLEDYTLVTGEDALQNNIKLSNAQAYDNQTKAPVEIKTVDTSKVKKEPGVYDVTFTTGKGTSTTVKLTISKDWKTIGNVDKASDTNKTSDTTKNPSAIENTDDTIPSKEHTSTEKIPTEVSTEAPKTNTNPAPDTTGIDKTFEISNPLDITDEIDAGRSVNKVTIDGNDVDGSGYTVDHNTITIKKEQFASLAPNTTHDVVISYTDGSKRSFKVNIINYDENKVIKIVPILNMKKNMGVGTKFTLNLLGINKTAVKKFSSSNKKIATINKKGVIKAKKKGDCVVTAIVIQNGSYYTVKVKVHVKKKVKLYNLKKKALSKVSGELPEFNVYKRVFKGKRSKLQFTNVQKDAVVTYTSSNKKIATVSKKGMIYGKKRGFTVVTAKIQQNGKTYVTRLFVRVDDHKKNKQIKKYLK